MIKTKLVLCAENVVRDAETGSVSVFNLFDSLGVQSFPLFFQKLCVLGIFERSDDNDPSRLDIRIDIVLNKTLVFSSPIAIDFLDKKVLRFTVTVVGVLVTGPGLLTTTFYDGKRKIGSYVINVDAMVKPEVKINQTQQKPAKAKPKAKPTTR